MGQMQVNLLWQVKPCVQEVKMVYTRSILGSLTFYWPLTSDLTLRISFIFSPPMLNYPLVLTLYGIGGVKNESISPRSNVMFKRLHVIIATFGILKKCTFVCSA